MPRFFFTILRFETVRFQVLGSFHDLERAACASTKTAASALPRANTRA